MNQKKRSEIDIYNYFDYREYLQAEYTWRKQHIPGFSHRLFSTEAGISSPNYLFRILKGERGLNDSYTENFAVALGLAQNEKKYFTTLVEFNNAHSVDSKEKLLRSLLALRYQRGIHRIADKKLKFFSKWYYPVIRELAVILDWKNDYNYLARHCLPHITVQQARDAVNYLVKTEFLKELDDAKYERTEPLISSGDEVRSTVLRNYHKQTLTQSIEALDTIDLEDRDISSLTLSVSRKTFCAIKKEIQEFRKRLLAMAKEDTNPEVVCLTGIQLIPRSRITTSEKRGNKQ